MSIGQRIAQKRKEQGLSQEALGERLGVSRQSIYKWESEAALPEIEKLIALSRLFGVSVGWLLGVEEAPAGETAPAEGAPKAAGELTEAQLSMVEKIAERYIAAQPKPKKSAWDKWSVRILFAMCGAILGILAGVSGTVRQLDGKYNSLQSSVNSITYSVNSQIGGISDRVESLLKSQNDLTADYGVEIDSCNLAVDRVTFCAYAVPKTYVEGMTAEFFADYGGRESVPGSCLQNGQRFSSEIKCPLSDQISVSVVFSYPDGTRQTQLLDAYEGLYSASLPTVEIGDGLMWKELSSDGALTLSQLDHSCYVYTRAGEKDGASSAAEVRVGLFKNQKLEAWASPCQQPPGYHGFEDCSFCRLPAAKLLLTSEDLLQVAAVITDEYGRTTVSPGSSYCIDEDGSQLTFSSHGSLSSDPADWQFD